MSTCAASSIWGERFGADDMPLEPRRYSAHCACGFEGPERAESADASRDAREHAAGLDLSGDHLSAPRRAALNLTCPTCKTERALSPYEARRGYQCSRCADLEEGAY